MSSAHLVLPSPSTPFSEPIAITGIGCRLPGGGLGPRRFFRALLDGVDAIREVPADRWDWHAYFDPEPGRPGRTYARWGGFIDSIDRFDPRPFGLSAREAPHIDPQQRLLLEAAWEALEDAGQPIQPSRTTNTGVFVGISTNDYNIIQARTPEVDPYTTPGTVMSIASNRISYCLNLTGPSVSVDTACSSSLVAVHAACRALENRECDSAIAAGVNTLILPYEFVAFSSMTMLAKDGRCRAFDARGSGFVRAEGVGAIVLKRLSAALRNHDRIYALIRATGVNQDGRTPGMTVPSEEAQEALVRQVLTQASVNPSDVRYVEAHGTGTPVGDPIEARALGGALSLGRRDDDPLRVGSVKTNIGHLEAGAGIAGIIKLAMSLYEDKIPPNLHFEVPNPAIDFQKLKLKVMTRVEAFGPGPKLGGINSFGFGGTNGHALLEAPPRGDSTPRDSTPRDSTPRDSTPRTSVPNQLEPDEASEEEPRAELLVLSAKTEAALKDAATQHAALFRGQSEVALTCSLTELCAASALRRGHHEQRLAVVATSPDQFGEALASFARGDPHRDLSVGSPVKDPRLAFVYSGQGPQWWGMGRELYHQEPIFRRSIEASHAALEKAGGWSLLEELLADEADSKMKDTAIAQPAIFALQTALTALWKSYGLAPAAVVGHSVGEVAAFHEAGIYTLEDAMKIIYHRGRTMSRAPGGRMLAAGITAAEAERYAARSSGLVFVAALNSPGSVTLSGDGKALAEISADLDAKGAFARFLQVPYAFHSGQMDPVRGELLECLRDLRFEPPRLPIISTVTGELVTRSSDRSGEYWWKNVRQTVRFAPAIDVLGAEGLTHFLEIGPHPVLGASIKECLSSRGAVVSLPTLRRGSPERATYLSSLGALHTLGHEVHFSTLYPEATQVDLPGYPFQRERFWAERYESMVARVAPPKHAIMSVDLGAVEPVCEGRLDPRLLPWLTHHAIERRPVFPGAGYLEIVLGALRDLGARGSIELEDVELEKALFLPTSEEPAVVQLVLRLAESIFEIHGRVGEGRAAFAQHARGRVRQFTGPEPPRVARAELLARLGEPVDARAMYSRFEEQGLDFGPMFQTIQSARRSKGEALGRVELPTVVHEDLTHYVIHPALLDGCLQVVAAALPEDDEMLQLPVRFDRVRSFGLESGARALWALAVIRTHDRRGTLADVTAFDDSGRVCLEILGFRTRALGSVSRDSLGELTYELRFKRAPLEGDSRRPVSLDFGVLTSALNEHARRCSEFLGPRTQATRDRVAEHVRSFVHDAVGESVGAPILRQFALDPKLGLADSTAALIRDLPSTLPELSLLEAARKPISGVVKGATQRLDPAELALALEAYEAGAHDNRTPAFVVARAVAEYARAAPEGRALRVIELGGSTAALSARVLPELPDSSSYLFTDRTDGLFSIAEAKLREYPFARTKILDFDADFERQGLELGSFDLVIAREVLSASSRAAHTIHSARRLLAPGGLFVGIEPEILSPVEELTVHLGRAPSSDPIRPEGRLLTRARWLTLLRDGGFADASVIAQSSDPGKIVLLARASAAATISATPATAPADKGSWLVFGDEKGTAPTLAKKLVLKGQRVTVVRAAAAAASPTAADFDRALGATDSGLLRGIVSLAGLDAPPLEADQAQATARILHGTLALAQALARRDKRAPLYLVTRRAQPVGRGGEQLSPLAGALLGLGRTFSSELPVLGTHLIDLDRVDDVELDAVVRELLSGSSEDEVALQGEARLVPRLIRGGSEKPARVRASLADRPASLEAPNPGALDALVFRDRPRRSPAAHEIEIEIEAAALNFRDVMKALGIYPGDAPDASVLGDEGAGRVVAVGSGVSRFAVGDEVIAVGGGYLGGFRTTHESFAIKRPRGMTAEEATTTPVAYMTARYALIDLGRMREGERVLIHAATGGVGWAAVALALAKGAQVFATAGSPEKRALLRKLGVSHVMDSRSLEFADQVMEVTKGRGVDLVLNSLAGDAIEKSLSVLGPRGRFLEIGKRDIYGNTRVGLRPFRNSLSYFAIDLGATMEPDFVKPLLSALEHDLVTGAFRPLPFRAYPIGDAVSAFRAMTQARQIGKLVLSMPGESVFVDPTPPRRSELCGADGVYVVTGGTSGFGLESARWLVDNGARHLVLMSRSGAASETSRTAITSLEKRGASVIIEKLDVADEVALTQALERARSGGGRIRGVIHSAMVLDDALIGDLTAERFAKVMRPKALGARALKRATHADQLDFFVLYSSVSSVIGNPGQASYAAANAYLDTLAHECRRQGIPALVVNFGPLSEVGVVTRDAKLEAHFARMGLSPLSVSTALRALGRLLRKGASDAVVLDARWDQWAKTSAGQGPKYSELMVKSGAEDRALHLRDVLARSPGEELQKVEAFLREQIGGVLRAPAAKLDPDRPLTELGLDSLMAVELMNRIELQLGVSLPTGKFLGGSSIKRMSGVLIELLRSKPAEVQEGVVPIRDTELEQQVRLDADLSFGSYRYDAHRLSNPRGVFVTGPMEMVGAHLVSELVEATGAKIFCLVDAKDENEGSQILARRFDEVGVGSSIPRERFEPVVGDLARPRLGLSDSSFGALAESVDVIIHNGALVNHVAPYSQLAPANVRGTVEVIRLALAGSIKPIHYVSGLSSLTAHLCKPDEPILESDPLLASGRLAGGYAQSRWVAEKILGLASERGLPAAIYRPGLLLGDVGDAAANVDDLAWRALAACVEVGAAPEGGWDVFLTPVSYVRRALVSLMLRVEPVGSTYHLVASDVGSMATLSERLREFGYSVSVVPREEWERRVKAATVRDPSNPLVPYVLLPKDVVSGLAAQGGFPRVDDRGTRAALEGSTISCPAVGPLVRACLSRFVEVSAWKKP
ncbi:MAG: thioester reductase domain-containing protein [Deltaproteobacteria bacterium]|nr:thioester reductase domain-containing protein [Deltaproteobacteria bacterium]